MSTVTSPKTPRGPHAAPSRPRPPAAPQKVGSNIDPFKVLRRHVLLLIGSAIVGVAVGFGAHVAFSEFYPLYSGDVKFEIKPGVQDARDVGTTDIFQDQLVLRIGLTESVILTSREVLETALRDPQVRRTTWFQKKFVDDDGVERVDRAVDELMEDLRANVLRNTNLFALKWSTHHANDVPIVLNSIAKAYLDKRLSLDEQNLRENLGAIRAQLQATQGEIQDIDQEITRHIHEGGMDTLSDPRDSQIAYQMRQLAESITESATELSMARSAYFQVGEKLEGRIEPTSEDRLLAEQTDPSVVGTIQQIMAVKTELREKYAIYRADHQVIARLEGRLRALELELETKIEDVMRRNLQAELKSLGDQVEQLQATLERAEEEYEAKDAELRELTAKQSEYETLAAQRDYLTAARDADLQLIKEIQLLQLRLDAQRIRLAERALEPREMSFPQLEIVVPLGALLVISLTVGLIFIRELTDQRVKAASDIAVVPGAHVLGVAPDLADDPTRIRGAEMVVRKDPHSVLAESYRQAFAAITKLVDRAGHQTILIVGGLPGAGTTTAATNIAASWAAAGRKVVVVDANFRRPRLAEAMDVAPNGPGFGDVLAGIVTWKEAVVDAEGGVSVLPVGSPGNRVVELLNTRQFESLLGELRAAYDMVIFDAPPAVVASESMVIANRVDAAVLVVRAQQEQRGLVSRLVHQLSDAQCDLLGVLLNRPRGTAGGYFKKNFAAMAAYAAPGSDVEAQA